jgi:hypothetical protein
MGEVIQQAEPLFLRDPADGRQSAAVLTLHSL